MIIDKLQASGNDFIIVENIEYNNLKRKDIALKVCDRHFGVGADGIVFLNRIEGNKFDFRIWNNNGTEAEISGNGLINAGAFVALKYKEDVDDTVYFLTKAGERDVKILDVGKHSVKLKVDMGKPLFSSDEIPFYDGTSYQKIVDYPLNINKRVYNVTILSMGNPHTIVFLDSFPSSFELQQIGKEIESHAFFPNRTNVEFVKIIDRNNIEVLFWERGVGETLSSGSGSSAAVIAGRLKGALDENVSVKTKAGEITIECIDEKVYLNGISQHILNGEFFISDD